MVYCCIAKMGQEVSVVIVVVRKGRILNEGNIEWCRALVYCCIAKVGQKVSFSVVVVVRRLMASTAFARAVVFIFILPLNEC